ncbi:TonB-dependent siderophore receptor [Sphingomonas sp. RB56-2]|uniref:TonB-dependent siderophore receptor n=1 Tax=Sphingomonas brevis TaxID=2908206 RepID=A0ABT0SCW5_9SPHN|nr:TonB-dependent siderophore receptor [Sphingomonas brevis]MCL6742027.1 TonB-dependent siderophore receptor [Sphingomonas brevis]
MFRASAAALLASSFLAMPAFAADVSADASSKEVELAELAEPIIVVGQRGSYDAKESCAATKTCTPLKDVPQSVSVITSKQIDDQTLRSISDVVLYVPGASFNSGEGNRDTIVLRGNSSTADFFTDGVRDDVQYFRDFYNVDRIEVLKGPNAMIFGRGGGGGVVNRVTKRGAPAAFENFAASGDSEGGFRLTGDVNEPLGGTASLRVNGLYEDGDSFRHHVDLKRYGINPTVGIQAGEATRIDLSYEYFHDRRTADRGVPSVTDPAAIDEPLKGFDSIFFGDPDQSLAKVDAHIGVLAVEHQLGEGLTLRNRLSYGHFDKFYQNIFAANLIEANDTVTLNAYNNGTTRKNLFNQTDLIWENQLGGIDQTLLFGFEVGQQKSRNLRETGFFDAGTNIVPLSDPTVDLDGRITFARAGTDADNRTKATIAAVYVQDQIRPADWIEIIAGLRFDSFKLSVDDFRPAPLGGEFGRRDKFWSPRLGLILKPSDKLSFYGSFSRSYLPQSGDQFGGLDINTEALKPERFDNYEIGAKWQPIDGLLATAAIYQLDRTNTRVADPSGNGTFLLSGKQRSKGIELGLTGNVTSHWQMSAGLAWQKAEVTEATTACPSGDCEVPLVPRRTASLWNRYDVTQSLGVGLGIIARSKSFTTINNQVKLPGYARVDGAIFYKITRQVEAQVNVENIFGADYFPTANGDNNIAPGAPTTVRGTIRFGL